jgi:hypothetical protein
VYLTGSSKRASQRAGLMVKASGLLRLISLCKTTSRGEASVTAPRSSGRQWRRPIPCRWSGGTSQSCRCFWVVRLGAANLGERVEDLSRPDGAYHAPPLDPIAVEPRESKAKKADPRRLLLFRQYLEISNPSGIITSVWSCPQDNFQERPVAGLQ